MPDPSETTDDRFGFDEQSSPYRSPLAESLPPEFQSPTWVRYGVLAFLCLLSFILYLDRVCIGQAVKAIEADLGISHRAMGFVLAAFTVAYGLFEVPTGHWGDRYGSRGILTRIVVWWSAFTMLTGAANGLVMLLIVRFLFGAGEAGALPNACRVVAKWFPVANRGRIQGIVVTSAVVGGAVAPLVTADLIEKLGWRWTFALLGLPGIVWAVAFHWWFRDDPAEHPGVNAAERQLIAGIAPLQPAKHSAESHPPIPWGRVLTSANIWLLGSIISCNAFSTYMVFSWYPTYMQEGRGVTNTESGRLASLVLTGGVLGGMMGGWLSDTLVRGLGSRRRASRVIGPLCMTTAAAMMATSIQVDSPFGSAVCVAVACMMMHAQLASWWGVVTEISGPHVGALFGLMNSLGVPGAVASQLFLGAFVDLLESYGRLGRAQWDPAFYIYAGVLLIGATCWLFVDANKRVAEH